MSEPAGYIPVLSNLSYALPLVLVVGAGALWWWATRVVPPPYFSAARPFRSWRVSPVAAAYASLQQGRYLLAAFLLRERVVRLVQERYGVASEQLKEWAVGASVPELPNRLRFPRVLRDLTAAYRSAFLAEGVRPWETFSGFTLPIRRRRAARDFARAAAEVEIVVTAWEPGS